MDNDWKTIKNSIGGKSGPYTLEELERCVPTGTTTYYDEVLKQLGMLTIDEVAENGWCVPETIEDCFEDTKRFVKSRLEKWGGVIVPVSEDDDVVRFTALKRELHGT